MIIKGKDLIAGIRKAKGVVDDSSVISQLRGFSLNPKPNGVLDIIGTDSNITILASVPYVTSEKSDGTTLDLESDQIGELIRYIKPDDDVEFEYTGEKGSDSVTITIGTFSMTTFKKDFGMDLVDYDSIKDSDFDDEVSADDFKFMLDKLLSLSKTDSVDHAFQTVCLDGERAFITSDDTFGSSDFITSRDYMFDYKSGKQILLILKSKDIETIKLKYIEEKHTILIKTAYDILTLKVMSDEIFDVSDVDISDKDFSVTVNLDDLVMSIHRILLVDNQLDITMKFNEDNLYLEVLSDFGGEAHDILPYVEKTDLSESDTIYLNADRLLSLLDIIKSENVELGFDFKHNHVIVSDDTGYGLTTFNLL